jgi:hypothetical protein
LTEEVRLTEADRQRLLHDLMQVGLRKPLGYVPLYTLKELLRRDPEDIASEVVASGLAAAQFGPDRCCIKSGALYVYDREALAELLQARADVLLRADAQQTPTTSLPSSRPSGSNTTTPFILSSWLHSAGAHDN